MIEYLQENYVWFIVGGIILLMTIIGYFADKTDFGRKQLSKRVYKEVPKEELNEEISPVQEEVALEPKKKEKNKKEKKKKQKEEPTDNIVNIDQIVEEQNLEVQEEVADSNVNIDESLFAPLTDEPTNSENSTVGEVEQEVLTEVTPSTLTDSDELNPVSDDDDIWKF